LTVRRERKSHFVRLFDKTPPEVVCPHFYELILSNGCPYDCLYCYLKLTFRGRTEPTLFENGWKTVRSEIDTISHGLFSTGELADSLAIIPPLLPNAISYFSSLENKTLLLVTKSTNVGMFCERRPSKQIVLSFSINSIAAANTFEKLAPSPIERLEAASSMKRLGWRVRIRIDPIILESGLEHYEFICKQIAAIKPERVTLGTLRQYPGLFRYAPDAPKRGLVKAKDGRMRYPVSERVQAYKQISSWLGFQPSLCKETKEVWNTLGWEFNGCNCTP
jgi:spore photoproduct lyase